MDFHTQQLAPLSDCIELLKMTKHSRIDAIHESIAAYRQEHEKQFALMSHSTKSTKETNLDKIFDTNVLLSPDRSRFYTPGEWPTALVANFSTYLISIGNYESSGSLWKFHRRTLDTSGPLREVGEKPLYLMSNLSLTESKAQAAEWIVSPVEGHKSLPSDIHIQLHLPNDEKYLCCNDRKDIGLISADDLSDTDVNIPGQWVATWILQREDALMHESIPFIDDELNR